ncbi:ATP-binding protein [Thiomicrorhabdus aquaedulcis]|uniref:ATP-binding protein n=1 Tax=Thiomicrorhabdus aquaedulcis TaxID=2211106 RepID=UPI001E62916A|nr:ATP-binding protein [Thiomicrorhabdus aquaedulcis]
MLKQLGAYERYLKQLPKTLRHELHNPLNKLSMSLTLLDGEFKSNQLDYAQHALAQLKQIIFSLSEATSIEDSLNSQPPEPFRIGVMLNHYMQNTIALHPDWSLAVENTISPEQKILGDGFMLEQLLDKLISNAKDFSDNQRPITVKGWTEDQTVKVCVENSGPELPSGYEQQIFDGMTSIRTLNQDDQAHLGLGLHIVKLITDYHHGKVYAQNMTFTKNPDISGVRFTIELPLLKS